MDCLFGGNVVLPFAEYIFRYEVAGITVYFRHPHKRSWIVDVQSVLGRDCLLHAIINTEHVFVPHHQFYGRFLSAAKPAGFPPTLKEFYYEARNRKIS